jgi:subtilase family serine protease
MGILEAEMPKVYVIFREGATNNTSNASATQENTLDIETIGGVCPSPHLNIILLVYPNNADLLPNILTYIKDSVTFPSNVINISWGVTEFFNEVNNTRNNTELLLSQLLALMD